MTCVLARFARLQGSNVELSLLNSLDLGRCLDVFRERIDYRFVWPPCVACDL